MKFLKCACQHCGGRIEYPADAAGMTIECPHCQQQTDLTVEVLQVDDTPRGRSWLWLIGVVILLGALGAAAPSLLKRLAPKARQAGAAVSPAASAPAKRHASVVTNDFEISPVKIERATNSTVVYATGTVKNLLGRQRFGVRIDLELQDTTGAAIGTTTDYASILDTNATWQFKALVLKNTATAAVATQIREQQ